MASTKHVIIAGNVGSGKTTLGSQLGTELKRNVKCTDDCLVDSNGARNSREASGAAVRKLLDSTEPLVIEGTMSLRAIDRYLRENPDGELPIEKVIFLEKEFNPELITDKMRGINKISSVMLSRLEEQLEARGISIERPHSISGKVKDIVKNNMKRGRRPYRPLVNKK